ncbi:MAG: S-methyl-5-thioribose-1-phosphate isomerase [Oscillospiraceae bacterium]
MDALRTVTHSDGVKLSDDRSAVVLLDQTQLPNREIYLTLNRLEDCYEAIAALRVRGAPAIGIFAGYALAVLAGQQAELPYPAFLTELHRLKERLNAARPTAVNLSWALERMERVALEQPALPVPAIVERLQAEALAIHQEDISMCRKIAAYGLSLLHDGDGVLTHCNAGPLATSRYGTALGPILLGQETGIRLRVFADETRPLLQGARLTSYELQRAGVDVTLICDNMASIVMKNGWINACFVGSDRIAMNGDFANKIGTSAVAILAKHYGIPFYALAPTSTIDPNCPTGDSIPIELREPAEIREKFYSEPMALPSVKCYNPAFDVTEHQLVTGIITQRGICYPPFTDSLAKLFA